MGSVQNQSRFVLITKPVIICLHFGLIYAMRNSLQAYSMWKLAKIVVNCGERFDIWRGDKGPCIVQRELSAALVLPTITC